MLLPHHPRHTLEWLCHQYWSPWTGGGHQYWDHVAEVPAMQCRTSFMMRDHHLPMIILCSELSTGYRHRGAPKNQLLFERIPWCLSHQLSLMVHPSWWPWHLASYYQQCCLLFKNTHWAIFKNKITAEGRIITLYYQTLTRPSAVVAVVLLTTSMPAINVDHSLLNVHSGFLCSKICFT